MTFLPAPACADPQYPVPDRPRSRVIAVGAARAAGVPI